MEQREEREQRRAAGAGAEDAALAKGGGALGCGAGTPADSPLAAAARAGRRRLRD